jgi:hypothetical protein
MDEYKADSPREFYKCLLFTGAADGNPLDPEFTEDQILNKTLRLKGFRIIPYYQAAAEDFVFSDGTTETVGAQARVNRLFDLWSQGARIDFRINGTRLNFFEIAGAANGYPMDLWLDNIDYLYSEKVQELTISIIGEIETDVPGVASQQPLLKVIVEVYLR